MYRSFVLVLFMLFSFVSSALSASLFEFRFSKVYAEAGQSGVKVPMLLSNSDSVQGWTILISFDTTGGAVTGVDPLDSIQAVDPEGDTLVWFFAPWAGDPNKRPEYLNFFLNVDHHPDWVKVSGFMDWPTPPIVPPISPGENLILFCLAFDVKDSWDGHDLVFSFETHDCTHNTLTNPSGYTTWGPDTASADPGTCPQRIDSVRAIKLTSAVGIGVQMAIPNQETEHPGLRPTMEQNSPNPFSHSTTIHYWLPHGASVKMTIWDARGTLQNILVDGPQPAGSRFISWDGRDDDGNQLPNGVYFCRIETSGFQASKKLLLLR